MNYYEEDSTQEKWELLISSLATIQITAMDLGMPKESLIELLGSIMSEYEKTKEIHDALKAKIKSLKKRK